MEVLAALDLTRVLGEKPPNALALYIQRTGVDFTGDEGSDEESDEETVNGAALSRGKQRALRILESAAKVPEEGMWRSLANN